MRVSLLTVGEPLPTDRGSHRIWRTGLLAEQLLNRGHEVAWWSSTFDHFQRRQRSNANSPIRVSERLTVWHLDGVAYQRNVSLARIKNHRQVAENFRALAPLQNRPDVILSSLPTLELCCAAVDYGAAHRVPVALDIRDLWPDVVLDVLPALLRPAGRVGLHWMTRELRHSTRQATAILGVTDEFVQWGLTAARRTATSLDRSFAMAYSGRTPDAVDLARADEWWRGQGIADSNRFIVCFFGTIGWMFDFDTVIRAAARLADAAPHVLFVICGSGERLAGLKASAAHLPNVLLPGRVGPAEMTALMRRSAVGLAPYRPLRNFQDNLPNKPIEYLSAGLPIVASRLNVLSRVLDEHRCGLSYEHGDDQGLANAVRQLSSDEEPRREMSLRAERLYAREYVAEREYDRMASHLERIAAHGATQHTCEAAPYGQVAEAGRASH